jgi:hypothetical protein
MGPAEEEIRIEEGMRIVNEDREPLGKVAAVLIDEATEEGAFVLLAPPQGGRTRLLPIEVIVGQEGGALLADILPEDVPDLPEVGQDRDPTEEEMLQAYDAVGLSPPGEDDEDEE